MTARSKTPIWREFEELVSRLERVLAGPSVNVTSPDRVRSLITGRMREVDATLRTTVGSVGVLITVECRKRTATQDVTWIEQLGSKKQAIGAAKTIAVASSAFSSDAIRAAGHYGIDLRMIKEINDTEIESWILPRFVVHVYKECDLVEQPEVIFLQDETDTYAADSTAEHMANAPTIDSAIFQAPGGIALTFNDLWLRADDQLKIFDSVPKDDAVHKRHIVIKPSDELLIRTRYGYRRVESVRMKLTLRWKHEHIKLADAKVVSYVPASAADPMPPQVRAEFEFTEARTANLRFGMQFQPGNDSALFTVQLTPGKK